MSVGPFSLAPTRLQHGSNCLFGREQELAALDEAWNDAATHVLTVVAWGGVGKTSLAMEWMACLAAHDWRLPRPAPAGVTGDNFSPARIERVFDWSFYSQGTSEQGAASSDTFVAVALEFFGDATLASGAASPWIKGTRLAQLVAERPTLLVLDGLEPMQHPPGPLTGQLRDPALAALLRGLAQHNPGLCLVTTRERVADLATFRRTVRILELQHLAPSAGVALLKSLGVRGSDAEFHRVVEEVSGHALTLNLLGRYLARAHGGDIRRRAELKFETADSRIQGGHAFKTMAAYGHWLAQGPEDSRRALAILRLLGLFDRPADAACLAALRREPAIPYLTEPLIGLDDASWNLAVECLRECGLVAECGPHRQVQDAPPNSGLDVHPLVREHFGRDLREKNPVSWRSGHRRLYEHLKESFETRPAVIAGLQPLYQAVVHGCQAGLVQEAYQEVYWQRILRGHEYYSINKLGAFGTELGALTAFFDQPWSRASASLPEEDQAWLLNQVAFYLRALGRLTEAFDPIRAALKIGVERQNWEACARRVINLSELELILGQVPEAVHDAEQSVAFARRGADRFLLEVALTKWADALHQSGRGEEAMTHFRHAEILQAERSADSPMLYSVRGFQYCDLLLAEAERAAAWLLIEPENNSITGGRNIPFVESQAAQIIQQRCREVQDRAGRLLIWAERNEGSILDLALSHLILGRAVLYRTLLAHSDRAAQRSKLESAHRHIEVAVSGLRRAGTQHWIPAGLLTRAWLGFLSGHKDAAAADLDEAWQIAERSSMRIHMADIHLGRARLFHDRDQLAQARRGIEQSEYLRRQPELEDAESVAGNWPSADAR